LSGARVVVSTGIRSAQVNRVLGPDALRKPFGMEELVSTIARVAGRRP